MTTNKMKVEIWSDVVCPFCYIGKRKFEAALSQFNDAANIQIVWKSFQLAPEMKTQANNSLYQFLVDHNGMSMEQAIGASDQLAEIAQKVGLVYNFDKAIPANSFNANRFSHLAKHHNLQDEAEESLFRAYFTEGRNIDDIPTLILLGLQIGLDPTEVQSVLESDQYSDEVRRDIYESTQKGVTGIPFFVFDGKLSLKGAQETEILLETLQNTFAEWRNENPTLKAAVTDNNFCTIGEDCI